MTVTVSVGRVAGTTAFEANKNAVDLGYFWARSFFEDIGLNIDVDGSGMIGDHAIRDFKYRCENYSGASETYAARIVKLCEDGIDEGATRVFWA